MMPNPCFRPHRILLAALFAFVLPLNSFAAPAIARGEWTAIGGELPGTDDRIRHIVLGDHGDAWVAGDFDQAGSVAASLLAYWDGSHWQAVGGGLPKVASYIAAQINVLARDPEGNLLVGGTGGGIGREPFLLRWNGTRWDSLLRTEDCDQIVKYGGCGPRSIAISPTTGDIHLAGIFRLPGDAAARPRVARLASGKLLAEDSGLAIEPRQVVFDGEGRLIAAGNGVMRRENGAWTFLGCDTSALRTVAVSALGRDSTGAPIVAGAQISGLGDSAMVARWDGGAWRGIGKRELPSPSSYDGHVVWSMGVDDSGRILVTGWLTTPAPLDTATLIRWNGTNWEGLSSTPASVATGTHGRLALIGKFGRVGSLPVSNVALREGGAWKALGDGIAGQVFTIVEDRDGSLVIGGKFMGAGGVFSRNVIRWDGGTWKSLGTGMNDAVFALAFDSAGILHAGGNFGEADGAACNRIARWDGRAWVEMGPGFDAAVFELVVDHQGRPIAGGSFTSTGTALANGVARWEGGRWVNLVPNQDSTQNLKVQRLAIDARGVLWLGGYKDDHGRTTGIILTRSDAGGIAWPEGHGRIPVGFVHGLLPLPNGEFLVAGSSNDRHFLERFQTDGRSFRLDTSLWYPATQVAHDAGAAGVFLGGTFEWNGLAGSLVRWKDGSMTVFRGVSGNIQALASDRQGRLLVGGTLTGKGGSSLARLENPLEVAIGDRPRRSAHPSSAFQGSGAGLLTARAGRLQVFDPAGRCLFSSTVPAGFALSRLELGVGIRIARLQGESVRFTRVAAR